MELLGASTKRNVESGGGSILSCCPHNPHGHERALKEEVLSKKKIRKIKHYFFVHTLY